MEWNLFPFGATEWGHANNIVEMSVDGELSHNDGSEVSMICCRWYG